MNSRTLFNAAASLLLVGGGAVIGADFTLITGSPVSLLALPSTPLPIMHWDLRKYASCTVPYAVNNAGAAGLGYAGTRAGVDNAFQQWTNVSPNLISWANSAAGAGTASVGVNNDRINAVTWDTNLCSGDPWDPALQGGAVAIAVINAVIGGGNVGIGNTPTGEIIEGDIVFDDNNFTWTNGTQNAGILFNGDDQISLEFIAGGARRVVIDAGANGICESRAICGDVQVAAVGAAPGANATCVRPAGAATLPPVAPTPLAGSQPNFTGQFDVWSICAHEVGHIHGLGENNLAVSNGNVLETRNSEPFNIPGGSTFNFTVNGNAVTVALTAGPARSAAQVAADINAAIGAQQPGQATATVSAAGGVVITATPAQLIIVTGGNALGILGVTSGESALPTMRQATLRGSTSLDMRTLERADRDSINFLYTHDLGDAPDTKVAGNPANQYQTFVKSQTPIAGAAGMLNGQQLFQPGLGPVHLFGTPGYRFEWLGDNENGSVFECEALVTNQDLHDDGVTLPAILKKGFINRVVVKVTHAGAGARYSAAANDDVYLNGAGVGCGGTFGPGVTDNPIIGPGPNGVLDTTPNNCSALGNDRIRFDVGQGTNVITTGVGDRVIQTQIPAGGAQLAGGRQLHFNGYFDFNGNSLFDGNAERFIFWSGIPGTTGAASANFVPGASSLGTNPMVLVFDIAVPATAPNSFWSRFRLDYGENEGRVRQTDPSLGPAVGVAQFGEVEDYPCAASNTSGVADQLHLYGPYPNAVSIGIPTDIYVSVQQGFNGVPNASVYVTLIQGGGQFYSGSPGPGYTYLTTDANGNAVLSFEPQSQGPFMIKAEIVGTPLEAYSIFNTSSFARSGDVNGDCTVDTADLTLFLSTFGGPHPPELNVDFNFDGQTNTADLTLLLSTFGRNCPPIER